MNPKTASSILFVVVATFPLFFWLVSHSPTPVQGNTAVFLPDAPPLSLTWQVSTLDSAGDVGSHISMAVQPTTGIPHIAYYSAEDGLKLAARTGSGNCGPSNQWQCSNLFPADGADSGLFPALAFRADGSYGLSYYKTSAKTSYYYDSQTTESTYIFHGGSAGWGNGYYNAITYDATNNMHLLMLLDNTTQDGLGYRSDDPALPAANCDYNNCRPHNIYVTNTAIDLDGFGLPAMVYSDRNDNLFYARRNPSGTGGNCMKGVWTCTYVDDMQWTIGDNRFNYLGFAFHQTKCLFGRCSDPTTIATYSYEQASIYSMEYVGSQGVGCSNASWDCTYIDNVGQSYNPGGYAEGSRWRMGMDIVAYDDYLLVFYQDYNDQLNAIIKMAYRVPEGTGNCGTLSRWQCIVVDDGERGGGFIDVGYGLQAEVLDDRILLAYHDLSHRDLIIAETVLPTPPPTPTPTPIPQPSFPTAVYLPFITR